MKKFLTRTAFFCLPLLLPILLFIIMDPFMIVMNNRGQIKIEKDYNITGNRDFQSTELFLRMSENRYYDSFIFGNSRSFFYSINTWKKYIHGSGFHFNSSNESLYGIERKLNFLFQKKIPVKNALLVIDPSTLTKTHNQSGHLFIKHPLLTGDSWLKFYKVMFGGFFPKPLFAYTELFLNHTIKPYMAQYGIMAKTWKIDYSTNQLTRHYIDSLIGRDISVYYKKIRNQFYKRDSVETCANLVIKSNQKELLQHIKSIFQANQTHFKIIISPLYDQKKLHPTDLRYLKGLFGEKNVFDFSGKNAIT